jgi:RNA polymerase primary sigma factor
LVRAVFACKQGAWELFVRHCQADVFSACRFAFPDVQAADEYVRAIAQLRANDFALLRPFDGRATLSGYLRLVLRDVLCQRVARLLADEPDRGWRAFEHFFKRDIARIIARYFPGAAETERDRDLYHDVVTALIDNNYRRILAYDGQGSFGGYVLRIVTNLCIDLLRKDMPRRRLPAAIKRLPPLEQEVFRQLYWEGCPPEQVASAVRKEGIAVDGADAIAAAIKAVRAVLPAGFKAGDEERPRMVPMPSAANPDEGPIDLPDDGPTPEEEAITRQQEQALEQATGALRTAIAQLPAEIRLYLQHSMSGEPPPAPRDIARRMGRPATEIYALRQQAERLLRQALRDNAAVKNLHMSV